jgi:hypothetical protein
MTDIDAIGRIAGGQPEDADYRFKVMAARLKGTYQR